MEKLVSIATEVSSGGFVTVCDDFTDRMNHRYTVVLLVVFTALITGKLYWGDPITCWAPAHFKGSHIAYTNSYCWVKNTYYLDFEEEIPEEYEEDKRHTITYYQWMPFIFLTQALLFYLPNVVWTVLKNKSGIDWDDILQSAAKLQKNDHIGNKERNLALISKQIERFLQINVHHKETGIIRFLRIVLSKTLFCIFGRRSTTYLVTLYLFVKLLYISNVIGQMFVLNHVLQMEYNFYGLYLLSNWGRDLSIYPQRFPRVTMCDFKIRRLGNVHRYTVQCVLSINLYVEQIFSFLWFWMVFTSVLTITSFVVWSLRTIIHSDRLQYVRNHLHAAKLLQTEPDRELSKDFVFKYLGQDGVFIMRMMSQHANNITVTDVIATLWENWSDKMSKKYEIISLCDVSDDSFTKCDL